MNKYKEIKGNTKVDTKEAEGEWQEQKNENEYLPTGPIDQDAAYVSVKAGATIKLGNYNMARVDVSLMYPCYPAEINDTYEKVKDWVDVRVEKEVSELRSVVKSNKVDL